MASALLALLLTLVFLWAGIDWRWAWLLACPLGVALALRHWWEVVQAACANLAAQGGMVASGFWSSIRCWASTSASLGGKWALLVASFHLQALGGLGLQYDSRDVEVAWVSAVGICSVVLGVILLLQVGLAWAGGWVRVLRANAPWQVQAIAPRTALWGGLRGLAICAAWGAVVWLALLCGNSRNSIDLVNNLSYHQIQVFSQARYAQELMRGHYFWAAAPDAPKPAWHQLLLPKSIAEAIVQSRHPADKWSSSVRSSSALAAAHGKYVDEATQAYGFGVSTLSQQEATGIGRHELANLIVQVKLGSPAAKAGVRRGDRFVRHIGDGIEISQPINGTQTTTITVAARDVYGINSVSEASFLRGDALLADLPRSASAPINGLYVAVHGFDIDIITQLNRRLEAGYNVALNFAEAPFFMRQLDTVVLDLRANGGGYSSVVTGLVKSLLGSQLRKGSFILESSVSGWAGLARAKPEVSQSIWFNATKEKLPLGILALKPKRLIVLTSHYTCSSAEHFIHGVREQIAPSAKIIVIGERTCGKPYGYAVQKYFGYDHMVMTQATVDAQGQPVYTQGLEPDCPVQDSLKGAVLSDQDALWQAARIYINTGQCPK